VIYGAVLARYPRYLPRFSSEPVANPETPDQIENQPL
jgi:hypothetical protein